MTCNGQTVFDHFGNSPEFAIFDCENDSIGSYETIRTGCKGHNKQSELIVSLEVDVLLTGNMCDTAKKLLKDAGIEFFLGVEGNAQSNVLDYLQGKLHYDNSTSHGKFVRIDLG